MKVKTKIMFNYLFISNWNRKSRKIARKYKKYKDDKRYPIQWRNDFVLKRSKKLAKYLKVNVNITGYENIPKNTSLIVANHASIFDPALIMMALEYQGDNPHGSNHLSVFLAKKEVSKNFRAKGYANMLDTFYIDRNKPREALSVFDDMYENAKEHNKHIVLFPEGTRSKDGIIAEFRPGAFRIAKKAFLPIVPITINNSLSITDVNRKDYIDVNVIIHKSIKPLKSLSINTNDLAKNVKKIIESSWIKPAGKRSSKEDKVA